MNLEVRKKEFLLDFLKIENEEIISKFEKILKKEKKSSDFQKLKPMTQEELNKRIDQSESDFLNNRFKNTSELLSKFK